jgi:hypothetical protein
VCVAADNRSVIFSVSHELWLSLLSWLVHVASEALLFVSMFLGLYGPFLL